MNIETIRFTPQTDLINALYKVSQNSTYKLGGEVENIIKNHNHTGKHGWKYIGGAVCDLQSRQVRVPHCRLQANAVNINRFTNAELTNFYFLYGLTNGNGYAAERLYKERFPTRPIQNHQKFPHVHQNLYEHESFRGYQMFGF
ncbi:hypothetical protein AVEN_59890-1 [Araneus ventricosus]|uniref:DUF4817 domain-containing protein n=1 Tax=Araneus ventricosus TaxID=182803 RepID=A0A4Y2EGQ5_ARAVE|nr:hypothetical protein AVEN_59890-1 [Araneus ventricosus]